MQLSKIHGFTIIEECSTTLSVRPIKVKKIGSFGDLDLFQL